ncbi:hypothetical protein KUCAC02_009155 [Chaenocephalus aceratus]|uniref:Uncharacterized protein n=1 Tax=Chaenocephalus aceratus TaxID=36190 RepID=A0ACB9WSX2_CHAAC|nr:hypothetical protein KUCAC02_009155 [Chaenocephalus aceratus]
MKIFSDRSEDPEARSRRRRKRSSAATATDPTTSHGDRIRVFPDYTQAVAKQRAAFRDVKGMLRGCDGVKYGLWYPSVLRITTADGKRHSFTDPGEAKDFVLRNVAKQSS